MNTPLTTNSAEINQKSQSGFLSLNIVTASCHAVVNTIFVAPDPKPTWFDGLNSKLDAAKANSTQWINNLAPKLTASIPTHVIDYATTYAAMTDQILQLIDKDPTAKGKDNPTVKETFALIDALSSSVGDIIKDVDAMQAQLVTWGNAMQKFHDDLNSGSTKIQNLEISLQGDIDKMNNAITNLNSQIAGENKAIAASAAAVGIGIFVAVAAIALAPETGGASLWVAGGAAAVVIAGGVTWGIMQDKINNQFDQISKDQQEISDDKRQIVALQGLSMASNQAINSIAIATSALSDVRTMWTLFEGELQGTKDKLDKADEELYAIVNKGYIIAAQSEWNIALDFAQQLVDVKPEIQVKTLQMSA